MDVILNLADEYVFTPYIYPTDVSVFSQDHLVRQYLSLTLIMLIGAAYIYFSVASLSYLFYFVLFKDKFNSKAMAEHAARPAAGQVAREIKLSLWSMPIMACLTAPIMILEVRGYSKLYDKAESWTELVLSVVLFLVFTDTCIYWIHRLEHEIPLVYKYIHKPHHAWIVPTPFAALAFHPLDGWLQSLPYHIFVFIFPLQKFTYLALFIFVQLWTISIHDGIDQSPFDVINGSAHHTIHHSQFLYNYGQFFTFWDRLGGTHKDPRRDSQRGPYKNLYSKTAG